MESNELWLLKSIHADITISFLSFTSANLNRVNMIQVMRWFLFHRMHRVTKG